MASLGVGLDGRSLDRGDSGSRLRYFPPRTHQVGSRLIHVCRCVLGDNRMEAIQRNREDIAKKEKELGQQIAIEKMYGESTRSTRSQSGVNEPQGRTYKPTDK